MIFLKIIRKKMKQNFLIILFFIPYWNLPRLIQFSWYFGRSMVVSSLPISTLLDLEFWQGRHEGGRHGQKSAAGATIAILECFNSPDVHRTATWVGGDADAGGSTTPIKRISSSNLADRDVVDDSWLCAKVGSWPSHEMMTAWFMWRDCVAQVLECFVVQTRTVWPQVLSFSPTWPHHRLVTSLEIFTIHQRIDKANSFLVCGTDASVTYCVSRVWEQRWSLVVINSGFQVQLSRQWCFFESMVWYVRIWLCESNN